MKTVLMYLVIALLSLKHLYAGNPLLAFHSNSRCNTKTVLITLDLSGCNDCIAPMDRIIDKLKDANPEIPIYILLNDSLSKAGEIIYGSKNNIDAASVKFVYNAVLHDYLISKTDHTPNITVVSKEGKLLKIEDLKAGDLGKIIASISPDLKIVLNKKTALLNPYISLNKTYSGILFYDKALYVFVRSIGMISKYSKDGRNLRNFFIDSLNLNYSELAKSVISPADYSSNDTYCQKNRPKKEQLMTPISVLKLGDNLLGINFQLNSFSDSLYRKEYVTIQKSYAMMVVVDTNFKLVRVLRFNASCAREIEPHCQGIYSDSVFYFLKVDPKNRNGAYHVGEFKQKGQELLLISEYPQPFIPNRHYFLEMLSNVGGAPGIFYLSYTTLNSKKTRLYKRSLAMGEYSPEVSIKGLSVEGWQIYETKKGNYVFVENSNKDNSCKAYDSVKQKVIACDEKSVRIEQETNINNRVYFLMNGYLYDVSYTE